MAIEERDKLELRKKWLSDLVMIFDENSEEKRRSLLHRMVREAEANIIALDDPAAADRHLKSAPEF